MFGIFKNKANNSYKNNIDIAYRSYKPEIVDSLFPGGKCQVENIVFSLAVLLDLDVEYGNVELFRKILDIYTGNVIRINMGMQQNDFLVKRLQIEYPEYISTKEKALHVFAFCFLNMRHHDFVLNDDVSFNMLFACAGQISESIGNIEKNEEISNNNQYDMDYGLTPNNPIYTRHVGGSNEYLSLLRTLDGEKLEWQREGSMIVNNVNGPVDIYVGILESGNVYETIYINMYGTQKPQKAPYGFAIVSGDNITSSFLVQIFDEENNSIRTEFRDIDIIKIPPSKYSDENMYYAVEKRENGKKVRVYCTSDRWYEQVEGRE